MKVVNNIKQWIRENNLNILRVCVSIIFLWFGILKFIEGVSPVQDLAISTIKTLTFDLFSDEVVIYGLALTEVYVGICMLLKISLNSTLYILYFQIIGTFMPFFIYPEITFTKVPFSLSFEGQYIVKNIVIIAAAITIHVNLKRKISR